MKTQIRFRGWTVVELMIVATIIGLLAAMVIPFCSPIGCASTYSTGTRIGVITKLSEKGLVFKSWEGEMNMGGVRSMTSGDGQTSMVANLFEFNVDPKAVEKVQAAMANGALVELVYRQWFIKPATISNRSVVIDVRAVKQR